MPTYSYACTACGNRFDVVQAFTDDALTTCDECSGRLRKLFGSVGVVFKGSGFYRTDSRAVNGSATSGAASSESSSTSNGDSSSSSSSTSTSSSSSSSSEKSSAPSAPSTATASS